MKITFLDYWILLDVIILICQILIKYSGQCILYAEYAVFSEGFSEPFLFSLPSLSGAGVVPPKPYYSSGPILISSPELAFREWTLEL